MVKDIFKSFCPSFEPKNGRAKDEQGRSPVVKNNTIQNLISQGEYTGLSSFVRAEGAFVQYRADGSYYRRVGLGITHNEFLIVSQILNDIQDEDVGELKIDLIFPLSVLHFFLLDQAAKRFAVCTCVGVLMFFAMCEDEPNTAINWDKWRRVIVPMLSRNLRESPWQHVWTSPYILNLSEKNDVPAFEYLATKKGKRAKRKLHFTQYPLTLRLVHSFGVQTDDKVQYPTSVVRPHIRAKVGSVQDRSIAIPSAGAGNTNVITTNKKQLKSKPLTNDADSRYRSKEGDVPKADLIKKEVIGDRKVKPVYGFSSIQDEKEKAEGKYTDDPSNYKEAPNISVWNQSTATGKIGPVQNIDFILNEPKKLMKFQTVPDQRLPMFYGGCRLLQYHVSTSSRRQSHGRSVRRSVSCDDLLLTNYGRRRTKLEKMVVCSWNPLVSTSPRLNSSDQRLVKKYSKFSQKMQEQASKGPLEMSSPTEDTEDIDQLVKEFSEKHKPENTKRSGRDLWMIARKKLLCRDTVMLQRLQNVVTTYVFKVSHRSSTKAKKLTDLTPLAVSLELHSLSRKLFLSITASDISSFHHQGIQAARSFSKILEFQDVITKIVTAQILCFKNLFDRIDALKFFIEVCLNLLTKNHDFQSFVSVMCALMSLPVYRLRNSWATFYMEYPFHFSYLVCMGKVLSAEKGFASYMSRIETAWSCNRPFIPWIEHFLVHCKKQPVCRRIGHRLVLSRAKVQKGQIIRKEDAPRDTKKVPKQKQVQVDEPPTKSQKHPKQFQKLFKPKKVLQFSSEVDIAEGHPSNHGITRGSKVPLGSPIVDIDLSSECLDQDGDDLDQFYEETAINITDRTTKNIDKFNIFCEETAAHVVDGAMKDIKEDIEGLQRIRRRSGKIKSRHQKTSGHYLKKKVSLDHEDFAKERQKEDEDKTKTTKEHDESRRTELDNIKRTIKEQPHAKERERKQTEMEEQREKHGILKIFNSWKKKSEKKESKVHVVKKHPARDTPDVKQMSTAQVQKVTHMPEKTKTREADVTDELQRDHRRKTSSETRGRLTIGPKPERLEKVTDQSKDSQPARKRKMSVMEMKKQNRRMSLFEQAEANRDRTRENKLEEEVKRRMADMRRKGSTAADLLNPGGMKVMHRKPLSRNNNFQEVYLEDISGQEDSDSARNFDKTDQQSCFKNTTANAIDSKQQNNVKALVEKFNFSNGNSINTAEDEAQKQTHMNRGDITGLRTCHNGENKSKRKLVNPCRSWSGCLLDSGSTRSVRECGLCANKDCMYINGLWQIITQFQMNTLKCDFQSSRAVIDCLKNLISASSHLSDSYLFQMSLNIES